MPQVRRAWVKPSFDFICEGNVKLISTQWHANSYQLCVHSAGQFSTSQSIKHRLCVRTRKAALEYTAFTGKQVVENARQTAALFGSMWCLYLPNHYFFTLCIMSLIPAGALQYPTKWKPTSLGFIQLRISQVLRVHKDLWLDLFSSSAVQIENHSGQFEPKRTSIVWTWPNSLTGFAICGAWTRMSRKSKWGSIT